MIELKFHAEGEHEVIKSLGELTPKALKELNDMMERRLREIIQAQTPKRKGNLAKNNQIEGSVRNDGISIVLKNRVEYAKFVVHGTRFIKPNNYPARGVEILGHDLPAMMERVLKNIGGG